MVAGCLGGDDKLDDKQPWEKTECEGSAREAQGRQRACYRLLLLTADLGLSGDVDSSLSLSLEAQVGGGGRMRG